MGAHLVEISEEDTPELEQINLLSIGLHNTMGKVRQPGKRQGILYKIARKRGNILGSNDKDNSITLSKLGKILAQLRHMRTAERSHEASIENEQDVPAIEIRKADRFTGVIDQSKIRRICFNGYFWHCGFLLLRKSIIYFPTINV